MSFFMTLWLVHGMTNVATLKSLIRSVFVLCKIVVLIIVGPHLTIYKLITYNARVYNSFRPNLFIKMLQLYHFAINLIFKFHSPRGHNSKDFLYWFLYRNTDFCIFANSNQIDNMLCAALYFVVRCILQIAYRKNVYILVFLHVLLQCFQRSEGDTQGYVVFR